MAATKVPSHLTEGLAKDDLSNVNAATGLAALGAAKADLSNVDAATGRAALGALGQDVGAGAVGSFAWLSPAPSVPDGQTFADFGDTKAGNLLVPTGQTGDTQPRSAATMQGTWRCLGYAHNNAAAPGYPATLWQRIS